MANKEGETGNIGDFPYEGRKKKPQEEQGGVYQKIETSGGISKMPGVGQKGGEGKVLKEYHEMIMQQREKEEKARQKVKSSFESKLKKISFQKDVFIERSEKPGAATVEIRRQNKPAVKVVFENSNVSIKSGEQPEAQFSYQDRKKIFDTLNKYI